MPYDDAVDQLKTAMEMDGQITWNELNFYFLYLMMMYTCK